MTVSDYSSRLPDLDADGVPDENANGTPNDSNVIISGQLVLWMDADDVEVDMLPQDSGAVNYRNSITGDQDTVIDENASIPAISVTGSQGQQVNESVTTDNTTTFAIATDTGGYEPVGGGVDSNQYGAFQPYFYRWYSDDYSPDVTLLAQSRNPIPYYDGGTSYTSVQWDGRGQVARGTPVALEMSLNLRSTETEKVESVASCMRWDPTQVYLLPMGSYPTVTREGSNNIRGEETASSLLEVLDVSQSAGGMYWNENYRAEFPQSIISSGAIRVQYGYDTGTSTWSDAVEQNSNECNNAADRVWVDSTDTTALESRVDSQGRYQFDMVRVVVDQMVWSRVMADVPSLANNPKADSTVSISLQGVVGNDLTVNPNGKSVYLHTSRAFGDWDVDSEAQPPTTQCYPIIDSDDWSLNSGNDGNTVDPATNGWCNQAYNPSNENPLDNLGVWSSLDTSNMTSGVSKPIYTGAGGDSDTDRITIVTVRPAVTKTNNAGSFDIADNGDTVDFTIDVSAVGSEQEALSNFVLSDAMPAGYTFVEVLEGPETPGATCEVVDDGGTETLKCRFSEEDPLVDTGPLPQGLPGGWSDSVKIRVKVEHASASLTTYAQIRNTANVSSGGYGPWDPNAETPGWTAGGTGPVEAEQSATGSASSYMPLGSAQGTIEKAANGEACDVNPTVGTDQEISDEAWAERCSMTDWDVDDFNLNDVDADGNLTFSLNYANTGNMTHTGVRLIDVLPFNGDGESEPASASVEDGVTPDLATTGDGRYPGSTFSGQVGLVSVSGDLRTSTAAPDGYWVTNADPAAISRDPENGIEEVVWCTSDGLGGWTQANASQANTDAIGNCADIDNNYQITAVFAFLNDVVPDTNATLDLTLDSENSSCSDVWTNTFGSRVNQIGLPVRSNDVSIMNNCNPKIDIEKYDTNDGPDDLSVTLADDSELTIAEGAHDADSAADAVDLSRAGGEEALSFTITNNGTENLVNVVVTDTITSGEATITDMACTFPGETDPTSGTQDGDGNWTVAWVASQATTDPAELTVGTSFGCTAQLSGVTAAEIHTDSAAVAGIGANSGTEVDDRDDYNAKVQKPSVVIEKYDEEEGGEDTLSVDFPDGSTGTIAENVHDADTEESAVVLTGASVPVKFTVVNNGTEALTDVVVTDTVSSGGATVEDMSCTFPGEDDATAGVQDDEGSWTVTWAASVPASEDEEPEAKFEPGASYDCTATVTGVTSELHTDQAAVSGVGFVSGSEVDDTDDYNAKRGKVSVGDYVWFDENHDGIQDADESGIENVTLTLTGPDGQPVTDVNGNLVEPTTTDENGAYTFDNLPILEDGQSYTVTVTPPDGYKPTLAAVGDRATDSSTGSASSEGLTVDGDRDPTLDFGFWIPNPGIDIEKYDTNDGPDTIEVSMPNGEVKVVGENAHDADTVETATDLTGTDGNTEVSFAVTNNSNEALINVVVTDRVTAGEASVEAMTCSFPGNDSPTAGVQDDDGNWSVTWSETVPASEDEDPATRFEVGDTYYCTAQIKGVVDPHTDEATVSGVGFQSGAEVTDTDEYHAKKPVPAVRIKKFDTQGTETLEVETVNGRTATLAAGDARDAQDADTAVDLTDSDGAESITFAVVNSGTEDLVDVVVTDAVTSGAGAISAMKCVFPGSDVATAEVQDDQGNWTVTWEQSSSDLENPALFKVGAVFPCSAELTGVTEAELHTDEATVTGVGVESGKDVSDEDPYNAKVEKPGVDIEKYDTNDGPDTLEVSLPGGESKVVAEDAHDADTVGESVNLTRSDGKVELTFAVTNSGTEPLTNVVVTEDVTAGGATVNSVECTFPGRDTATAGERLDDGSWRVTWAETFAAGDDEDPAELFNEGDTFYCTAQVTGVVDPHTDQAAVSAVGFETGAAVGDVDSYNANRDELPMLPFTGAAGSWLWLLVGAAILGGAGYAGVIVWRRRTA